MAEGITRAQLVDAARDLNDVLQLNDDATDPNGSMGIDVTKPVSKLRKQIVDAGTLLDGSKDDVERLAPGTVLVLNAIRDEILIAMPHMREDDIKEHGMEAIEKQIVGALDQVAERASELRKDGWGSALPVEVPEVSEGNGDAREPDVEATPTPKAKTGKAKEARVASSVKAPKKKPERKVFLGRFRKVKRGTNFSKVLEAALAVQPGSTIVDIAAVAGLSVEKAEAALKAARKTNGIDYALVDGGMLTIMLPKGIDVESVWHQSGEASNGGSEGKRGSAEVGVLKPVRAGTSLARMIQSILPGGKTIERVALDVGLRPDQVAHRIHYGLRIAHGINVIVGNDGVVAVPGESEEGLIKHA